MRNILLFLLLLCGISSVFSQSYPTKEQEIIEQRGELYFSFDLSNSYSLQTLSSIISIDKIENNQVYAYANTNEFYRFKELNISYQIEIEEYLLSPPIMASSMAFFMQSWDAYPTYSQYDSLMHKLANDYPDLCHYHNLGTLASGRKILALQLGDSVNVKQRQVRLFYTSSMHGNELTGYVLMLRLADYLLSNYGQNALVDSLMNNVEIWINPLANPDGAYQSDDNSLSNATRYNANNVNLNRNFPDPEDGQHPDGNSWQAETQYFMDFADSVHFTMAANFHDGNEVVNYPWDTWAKLSADDEWWKYISHQYADTVHAYGPSNYFLGPAAANGSGVVNGYQWYTISGGRQDYMNYYHQCRELTVELSSTKIPNANKLPHFWNYNYRSLLNYINQVRFGLRGVVRDSVSTKPIIAQVYINSHDKDSSQVYSHMPYGDYYRLLDSGYYSLTFSADHYYSKTIDSVLILRDKIVNMNVDLAPDYTALKNKPQQYSHIFPNPVLNNLFIEASKSIADVELYSLEGKLILKQSMFNVKKTQIRLVGVEQGLYFIRIEFEDGNVEIQKLIIQ